MTDLVLSNSVQGLRRNGFRWTEGWTEEQTDEAATVCSPSEA